MKRLYVTKVTLAQLKEHWGFTPIFPGKSTSLFIRCNKNKEINWNNATVYNSEELVDRNNIAYL